MRRPLRDALPRLPAAAAVLFLGGAPVLAAESVKVKITTPTRGATAMGPTVVAAEVVADAPIVRVVFQSDSTGPVTVTAPPYTATLDVGADSRNHRFLVTAFTATAKGSAMVDTVGLRVDDQVDIALRQIFATVSRGDQRVTDLGRDALELYDEGTRQNLVTFEHGDVPLTAVLMLDSSQSMAGGRLEAALRGAQAFIEGMKELDEASFLLFSDRVQRATPFTSSHDELLAEVHGIEAAGGTALNDALYLALKLLDAQQGRRVIILFSDGADVLSQLRMEDVLWKARRGQVLLYWIRLAEYKTATTSFTSAWRNYDQNSKEEKQLQDAIVESGGRIATIPTLDDVGPAFREILQELRDQYVLGYYPSTAHGAGAWHKVQVRVDGFGLRVRAREGYVDQ
jgi:Ca-activated chloride channel family protein